MRIGYGNGGWVRVDELGLPGPLYLRLEMIGDKLRVAEFYIDGRGQRITAAMVRALPLAWIEGFIASEPEDVTRKSDIAGPKLSLLASHYGTTFGPRAGHWVAESLRAGAEQPKRPTEQPKRPTEPEHQDDAVEPQLGQPPDGRLTDEFLREVTEAYRLTVARRLPIAETLAGLAGASERTIHRWLYTARKRGLMPPANNRGRHY